jgi:hypothetical protein
VVIVRQGLGNSTLADVVSEWQAARGRILRRCAELSESLASNAPATPHVSKPEGADAAEHRGPARGG